MVTFSGMQMELFHCLWLYSRQSEEPKKISVGIFEYILASMLKVFQHTGVDAKSKNDPKSQNKVKGQLNAKIAKFI